ncbi:Helix-turn-helix [Pedobacter sp. ok626]|uniref:helix-turn-helix domain-containing protein n=1 Tax=Pedobacter sp. ok626 TaxID=1761882 RepID=UPI00088E5C5D|nr:helix-turn-helix transcriptional regulator [Pedobacter sp. ok626]SDL11126.1 Helix-turn-helix [Pedobacter sp. ok626]
MRDENSRFRELVKIYRNHFSLSQENVANLYNVKQSDYTGVESGKRTIDLNLAEKIANVYGLSYCQMIDPNQSFPAFDTLPEKTKNIITTRINAGFSNRDYDKDVAGNLDKIINETTVLERPLTANEIRLNFPTDIRERINARNITDLLKKSGRDQIVVMVGKRGREYLFQLKAFAEKKV